MKKEHYKGGFWKLFLIKVKGNLNKTNFCFAHDATPTPDWFRLSNFSSSFYLHHCKLLFSIPWGFCKHFFILQLFIFSVCVIYSVKLIFYNLLPIFLVLDIKVISILCIINNRSKNIFVYVAFFLHLNYLRINSQEWD